jgi:hypothetical protein
MARIGLTPDESAFFAQLTWTGLHGSSLPDAVWDRLRSLEFRRAPATRTINARVAPRDPRLPPRPDQVAQGSYEVMLEGYFGTMVYFGVDYL